MFLFAQSVADKNREKFLSFIAESTTFNGGTPNEIHGRDAVMEEALRADAALARAQQHFVRAHARSDRSRQTAPERREHAAAFTRLVRHDPEGRRGSAAIRVRLRTWTELLKFVRVA